MKKKNVIAVIVILLIFYVVYTKMKPKTPNPMDYSTGSLNIIDAPVG
tara:strand:+ start:608 stop:748 length:141 start_codon:yes stop_codon:yes gene_type:complete